MKVIHCMFLSLAPLQNGVKANIISIFFNSLLSNKNINIFKWKRTHSSTLQTRSRVTDYSLIRLLLIICGSLPGGGKVLLSSHMRPDGLSCSSSLKSNVYWGKVRVYVQG